jgi:cytochrome c-type biogenesis protein CcmH/NrfF
MSEKTFNRKSVLSPSSSAAATVIAESNSKIAERRREHVVSIVSNGGVSHGI